MMVRIQGCFTPLLSLLSLTFLIAAAVGSNCKSSSYFKDSGPLVKTTTGSIIGKNIKLFDTTIAGFFGIPFAEPPLGEKRFKRPEPVKPWPGILDATQLPPPCMQYSSRKFDWLPITPPSENCLFLNIWSPAKVCNKVTHDIPVIVWIHGGGFYSGSTDLDVYDGSTIAALGNVVVVSISYRVGVFGFLNLGTKDAEGNMGLFDQTLALEWITNNIKYFRGDSESITLMGESAGALSVSMHIISPLSRKLFHRAILQSGSAYHSLFVDNLEQAKVKALTFAQMVGCGPENVDGSAKELVFCLQKKDPTDLAKAEDIFTSKLPFLFLPSIENDFLPKNPIKAFQTEQIDVDVLIGTTKNEGSIFLNYMMADLFPLLRNPKIDNETALPIIRALFQTVPSVSADNVFKFYLKNIPPGDSVAIATAISDSFGDYAINCPTLYLAENLNHAYSYWFTHQSLNHQNSEWLGVTHFDDVPYTFGLPIKDDQYTPEDGRFSRDLIHKWVSFARCGHPLEEGRRNEWPKFNATCPISYELNARNQRTLLFPRMEACEFWRPYFSIDSS
ncbi:acetylcholinesterase-like [Uloborus diversus]|uniref:acetylcholinesterase-like n=1 Tax=Uloborus diversus TaxID=327109 RepID=UPI00240A1ECF|nr:acetylcholinesterase-like [Uloborus diversus]